MSLASRLVVTAVVGFVALTPVRARAGNGAALVKLMPEDASIMVVADVASARSSPLFQKGLAALIGSNAPTMAQLTGAGIDPATAFDTIAVGGVGSLNKLDEDRMIVVAEGPGVQQVVVAIGKDKTVVARKFHGVTYWASKDGALAVVQKRLIFARPAGIERAIDLASGKGKNAARSPKAAGLRAAIAATDTRHALWLAAVLPEEASAQARTMGVTMQGVSFGATLTAGVDLEVKVITAAEAEATTAANLISGQLKQASSTLGGLGLTAAAKTIVVDHTGNILRLGISLSEAEIVTLAKLMGAGGIFGN
jgi:hypothetical protein